MSYKPPLRDILFVIEEVLQAPAGWRDCGRFADIDVGTARQVLEEGGRFASGVLAPINAVGDQEGCILSDGGVRTPRGFADAYRAFVDGGWPALACDPSDGGQGLPKILDAALYEMLLSANHAWSMYSGLLHGAYETIGRHGSEELKRLYLPKIARGEWLAAMALTESQAGTDLGLVGTRAVPGPDGSVRVTGSKVFISGGDHDMTPNIVHLTLCRLPDAPPGSKGLSLALVPKVLPDGSRNAMVCEGLEDKMGIHGSATCMIRYEEATGWLIGEPHRGLAAMFVMMNSARLHVALQGLGHLAAVTQKALEYAQERVQMRAAVRPAGLPAASADPIALHPAMRRTLWSLRALTEGHRVLAYWTAQMIDDAQHLADEGRRATADNRVALLTPLLKSALTRDGFQGSSAALQVFGGYGYVREFGIEQHVRDARIAMVYEGTNEIQAIDLLMRKVLADGGTVLDDLLFEMSAEAARCHADLLPFATALQRQCDMVSAATGELLEGVHADPEWPLRVADDFLAGLGYTMLAWAWMRIAIATRDQLRVQPADPFLVEKMELARFGIDWLLPDATPHWHRVREPLATLAWL